MMQMVYLYSVIKMNRFTESYNNDSVSHWLMTERNAMDWPGSTGLSRTVLLMFILLLQSFSPIASATDGHEGMAICSNTTFGLGGFCDTIDHFSDDDTVGSTWVEGMYYFNMTSASTFQFEAAWAIREWDKSGLGIFGSLPPALLAGENIGENDGIPADVLRAALDNNTDPNDVDSPTVEETLLSEIDSVLTTLLSSFGGADAPDTNWTDQIVLPDGSGGSSSVECSTDPDDNHNHNAFEPPICISTSVTISLDIATKYGLTDKGPNAITPENLDSAFESLLILGSTIPVEFGISVQPGNKGTYAIKAPDYATVSYASGTGYSLIEHNDTDPYNTGLWVIDGLNQVNPISADLVMTMAFRETEETSVVNIGDSAKSMDLRVVLDLEDENAASIDLIVGLYNVPSSVMNTWGINVMGGKADVPQITADGIRMAIHTKLLPESMLTSGLDTAVGGIESAIGGLTDGYSVGMGDFEWVSVSQSPLSPGGLNYSHSLPSCITGLRFCTAGEAAMGDDHPVYVRSSSYTFPLSLAGLLGGNLGSGAGFLNEVSGDDLGKLLNSGIKFSTEMSPKTIEDFVGGMLPDGMDADLTFEIILPYWARTIDGGSSISINYRSDGQHSGEISLTGTDSFDWNHGLCSTSNTTLACSDLGEGLFCSSSMKTCARTEIDLDISDLDFSNVLLTKHVSIEFSASINMSIHRIGIPEEALDGLPGINLTFEVVPIDLLKLIMDIGSRGNPYETNFSLPGCDDSDLAPRNKYCQQNLKLSNSEKDGIPKFASSFSSSVSRLLQDKFKMLEGTDLGGVTLGTTDLSSFNISANIYGMTDNNDDIGDEIPLSLNVSIPPVRFSVGLENTWFEIIEILRGGAASPRIGVDTSPGASALVAPFLTPMVQSMGALTNALSSSLVSSQGISSPVPLSFDASSINTTINEDFGLNVVGEMRIRLPLGLVLENASSSDGGVQYMIEPDTRRQVIVYDLTTAGFEGVQIEAQPEIGWNWIFGQLIYYFAAIFLFVAWRIRSRRVKRKRKRRQLELEQLEMAAETTARVYVAPAPTVEVILVAENGIVIKRRL